jgi:hypothetical protein
MLNSGRITRQDILMKTLQKHTIITAPAPVTVQGLAARFAPISLAEMGRVALLKRSDTKFVMSLQQLYRTLPALTAHYHILDIDGVRLHHYQTLYFDTADFALYRRHHSGGLNRYKVRYRQYVDSDLCFLEVKLKNNKRQTVKSRMPTPGVAVEFGPRTGHFLHRHVPFDPRAIEPKLWNRFRRVTLVSKRRVERITIDLELSFGCRGQRVAWPGVVVAEVKQPKYSVQSDFVQVMRALGLRPRSFSKYCMGVSLLYDDQVPYNRFKPNHLLIHKLTTEGKAYDERTH